MHNIAYVALKYNYGKSEEGYSYEYNNIEAGFRQCQDKELLTYESFYPDDNPDWERLKVLCKNEAIDAIFHVAFNESLDLPLDVVKVAQEFGITIIQWDCDSSWRFHNWVLPRKDRVDWFITTHPGALSWYKQYGMDCMVSQWAASPEYKRDEAAEKIYDISFIGQKHGQRPDGKFERAEIFDKMIAVGLDIKVWGNYWEGYEYWQGYAKDAKEMSQILNQSKICINLSNPWHFNTLPQIKGRMFEIAAVGGFQLTTPALSIGNYFTIGEEIVVASDVDEIIQKCKYYLNNEKDRLKIAEAAYNKTLAQHMWTNRLPEIFDEIV